MDREPAAIVGAVTTLVLAVCALLVAFGIDVSEEKQKAIVGCIGAAVPLLWIVITVIRQSVYAPKTVEKIKAESVKAGEVGGAAPVVQ